jgi:hypothetical protein
LPTEVFGPVDFFAFLRLASIFRGEDPFDEVVNVWVDLALELLTSSIRLAVIRTEIPLTLPVASRCQLDCRPRSNLRAVGCRLFRAVLSMPGLSNFATARAEFEPANTPFPLRL